MTKNEEKKASDAENLEWCSPMGGSLSNPWLGGPSPTQPTPGGIVKPLSLFSLVVGLVLGLGHQFGVKTYRPSTKLGENPTPPPHSKPY